MEKPKHSVLLVDDEPDILFSLKGLLRHEFDLHTAESGEQALEILSQRPIHVIMTDQRMPKMTGIELMNQVKTKYPDAIRLVFTGYADIKAVIEAINSDGLFRYITKPWDPDELIEVLHEAAAAYDAAADSRQLIDELGAHLESEIALLSQAAGEDSGPDSTEIACHLEKSTKLVGRIKQHLS